MAYGISSRDYLERAMWCLSQGSAAHLFYGALELRCGVEARMQEYLEGWEHVAIRKRQGWRIADLGKTAEKAFRTGAKIQRVEFTSSGGSDIILYYTPVSPALRKNGEKLGNYLHAMKQPITNDAAWWQQTRCFLLDTAGKLKVANTGTLLGPVLHGPNRRQMHMKVETLGQVSGGAFATRVAVPGKHVHMRVTYIDVLPDPIELNAHVWKGPPQPSDREAAEGVAEGEGSL